MEWSARDTAPVHGSGPAAPQRRKHFKRFYAPPRKGWAHAPDVVHMTRLFVVGGGRDGRTGGNRVAWNGRARGALILLTFLGATLSQGALGQVLPQSLAEADEALAATFDPGHVVLQDGVITHAHTVLPSYPCTTLSMGEEISYEGTLEIDLHRPHTWRAPVIDLADISNETANYTTEVIAVQSGLPPDHSLRFSVTLERNGQTILRTGSAANVHWDEATLLRTWSIPVAFTHITDALQADAYVLNVSIADNAGSTFEPLHEEVEFIMEACVPPSGLSAPADESVDPPPVPPMEVPPEPSTVDDEVAQNETRTLSDVEAGLLIGDIAMPQPPSLGPGISSHGPSGASVILKYAEERQPSCSQRSSDNHVDARVDDLTVVLALDLPSATRVDIYLVNSETMQERYRNWANFPAGRNGFCFYYPMSTSELGSERGRWHTVVRWGGSGGWGSGSTWNAAGIALEVQPWLYSHDYYPSQGCNSSGLGVPPRTYFYKTDAWMQSVSWWATDSLNGPYHVDAHYTRPGGATTNYFGYDLEKAPAGSVVGWCHWMPVNGHASNWPGRWSHTDQIVRPAPSTWVAPETFGFDVINRAPFAATSLSASQYGGSSSNVVLFDWAPGGDPDGDPVEYAVYQVVGGALTSSLCSGGNGRVTGTQCYGVVTGGTTIQWRVVTYDTSSNPQLMAHSATKTFTSPAPNPGPDGDFVDDADDADPTADVKIRFDFQRAVSSMPADFYYAVEVYEPSSVGVPWLNANRIAAEKRSLTTGSETRDFRDPTSFTSSHDMLIDVPDNFGKVWIEISLWDAGKSGADCLATKLAQDPDCTRLDINDYDLQEPDYVPLGTYGAEKRDEFGCLFELDLTTGHWAPIVSLGFIQHPGDRPWDPDDPLESLNNGLGTCAQSPSNNPSRHGYNLPHAPYGSHLLQFDIEITGDDGDGIPRRYELNKGLKDPSGNNRFQDSDGDGWTDYEEWLMRRDHVGEPSGKKPFEIGRKITLKYWTESGMSSTHKEAIEDRLPETSQRVYDATDGHVWISKWQKVSSQFSADVRIKNACEPDRPDLWDIWSYPAWEWPHATPLGYMLDTPTVVGVVMPLGYGIPCNDSASVNNPRLQVLQSTVVGSPWSDTLAHELGHYVLGSLDEYMTITGGRAVCYTLIDHGGTGYKDRAMMDGSWANSDFEMSRPQDAGRPGPQSNGKPCSKTMSWSTPDFLPGGESQGSSWQRFVNSYAVAYDGGFFSWPYDTRGLEKVPWDLNHNDVRDCTYKWHWWMGLLAPDACIMDDFTGKIERAYAGPRDPIGRLTEVV